MPPRPVGEIWRLFFCDTHQNARHPVVTLPPDSCFIMGTTNDMMENQIRSISLSLPLE